MKYANKLNKKDIKIFLTITKLKDFVDKFELIQGEDYCEVNAYVIKYGEKSLNFKLYLSDFELKIKSIGGGYYGLFTSEYEDKIRLCYKYFMSYKFGDEKKDYAPYKKECVEYMFQEYQELLTRILSLEKFDADVAMSASMKLSKALFTFKQDSVPENIKKTLDYLYIDKAKYEGRGTEDDNFTFIS